MNYFEFFSMLPEISLLAVFVLIFIFDLIATGHRRRIFHIMTSVLMLGQIILCLYCCNEETSLFGGMYYNNGITSFVKAMLTFGTLLVILQSHKWLRNVHSYYK